MPDLAVLWGTNGAFWDHYWPEAQHHPAEKWTVNVEAAERYGLNWIAEKNAKGLSSDPALIHHGHGGGYSMLNLAYLMGAERIVLLGYDLKYASDYDGHTQRIGSGPRHYFGEYPSDLQHWPKMKVKNGIHEELVEFYRSVAAQNLVEIINCTPDSAIDCYPRADINAL